MKEKKEIYQIEKELRDKRLAVYIENVQKQVQELSLIHI